MESSSSDRLRILFDRYLNSRATEQELEEMFLLAGKPENESMFRALLTESWEEIDQLHKKLSPVEEESPGALVAEFPADMQVRATSSEKPAERSWRPKFAVAAAIAIILLACFFLFQPTREPVTGIIKRKVPDFAPGRPGAILTLSNGSQITLDSSTDGAIAQQAGITISKQGSRLIYGLPDSQTNDRSGQTNTVSTPRGKHFQLVLPDGTTVWLNAASSITYPVSFSATERRISISGEAYLEVAKDMSRPFFVSLDKFSIRVTGTSFNVKAYHDEPVAETTLIEGSLTVQDERQSISLSPNQQAVLSVADERLELAAEADPAQAVAWKNGFFNFEHTELKIALRELARWYNVELSYEGKVTSQQLYGKMQRELYLSQVLNILKKLGVNYRIEDRRLIVMP